VPYINPGQNPGVTIPTTVFSDTEFNSTSLPTSWVNNWYNDPDGDEQNGTPMYRANTVPTTGGLNQILNISGPKGGIAQTGMSGQSPPILVYPTSGAPAYFEYRMYIPCTTSGATALIYNWPTGWLVTPGPWSLELDMFEGLGGYAEGHWHNEDNPGGGGLVFGTPTTSTGIIPNAYNIFGLWFANTGIAYWFLNGNLVGDLTGMYYLYSNTGLALVLENSYNSGGAPNANTTINTTYFRVWQ
jgi:hypothetical protein